MWGILWKASKYWLCRIFRWQYALLFKYRKYNRQSTRSVRKNVLLLFGKSLCNKCKKCNLLTSSKTPVEKHISNTEILNEENVELFGVNLECKLNIDFQVNTLIRKACKKYRVLARVCNYMNQKKQTYSQECFHNISVFLLPFRLDV